MGIVHGKPWYIIADFVTATRKRSRFVTALWGLVRTMRPKQWTKNLLFVFPGIVFDGQLFDPEALLLVIAAFFLLNMMSGSVYIINDLADIESDRRHPKKRFRPIPSGQLSVRLALIAGVTIPMLTLLAATLISLPLALILLAYLVLQIAYSFRLKHIVIIDLLTIMTGFVMRVAAGVVVIDVQNFSPWLYACTGLLALFLIVGKRRQELVTLGDEAVNVRRIYRDYNLPLIDEMLRVATIGTLITYTIYTLEAPSPLLAETRLGILTVPFVLYGVFRYLYLIYVRGEGSAPDEVLLNDRPLQIDIVLFALTFVIILYIVPHL
jgi:4-hydroxybenzoate polyprenyltransferase